MPAVPDQPDHSDAPGAWQAQLAGAFEILLGRALEAFDPKATYVLYHWDDMLSAELFDYVEDVALLGSTVPGSALGGQDGPLSWGRWRLDLGRSLFVLDGSDALSPSADAALRAASLDESQVVVTGADFVPVLTGGLGLPEDVFPALLARVETTGTLLDALRAATWTMGGPADLVTDYAGVTVEPAWERALAGVADPGLRRHLGLLCLSAQSARSQGAYYSGVERCPADLHWLADRPDHAFVTGWEFGEGQASSAIFAIDDSAPA